MPAIRLTCILVACTMTTGGPLESQGAAESIVRHVQTHPAFRSAASVLDRDYSRFVAETIALTEVPAPPFKEAARAAAYLELLRDAGLVDVERDHEGNVMGMRRGDGGPVLVIAAHLDSVFPEGTDVRVKRDGTILQAPGVGDDAHGLALLLALARAMNEAGVRTTDDVLFVGTVGEEGGGDLRGARYLFEKGRYKNRIGLFVSIDGTGSGTVVTNAGVASLRLHVTFTGPGGHSYGSFGLVSPAFALATAIHSLSELTWPDGPKTTYNVGQIGGGTAINAIPAEAWMDVDLRSESAAALTDLERTFMTLLQQAAANENRARSTEDGSIAVDVKRLGSRPAGRTPSGALIVKVAMAATRALDLVPALMSSSTDANLPMSLKVPAITIDSGMPGGRVHSPGEWLDTDRRAGIAGSTRALLILLSLAGLI
ncbi:MAG: M20/M25/M40 family metallo-hydrolase [Vicinamibacterales bacterium]